MQGPVSAPGLMGSPDSDADSPRVEAVLVHGSDFLPVSGIHVVSKGKGDFLPWITEAVHILRSCSGEPHSHFAVLNQ